MFHVACVAACNSFHAYNVTGAGLSTLPGRVAKQRSSMPKALMQLNFNSATVLGGGNALMGESLQKHKSASRLI